MQTNSKEPASFNTLHRPWTSCFLTSFQWDKQKLFLVNGFPVVRMQLYGATCHRKDVLLSRGVCPQHLPGQLLRRGTRLHHFAYPNATSTVFLRINVFTWVSSLFLTYSGERYPSLNLTPSAMYVLISFDRLGRKIQKEIPCFLSIAPLLYSLVRPV